MFTDFQQQHIDRMMSSETTKFIKVRYLVTNALMSQSSAVEYVEAHSTNNVPDNAPIVERFSSFTFGVEIECYAHIQAVINSAQSKRVNLVLENYNHRDNANGKFKFVHDGSVTRYARGNKVGIECVTPVLQGTGEGFKSLKKVVEALNENETYTERDCGLHVHIGASDLTDLQYKRIFKNYARLQPVIDSFLPADRRNNGYCKHLTSEFNTLNLENDNYSKKRFACNTRLFDASRYWVVNPCSYARHKTIEFRQYGGCVNFKEIQMWVLFVAKLVEYSKSYQIPSSYNSIDDLKFLTPSEKKHFKALQRKYSSVSNVA